jgi:hypothetical protein
VHTGLNAPQVVDPGSKDRNVPQVNAFKNTNRLKLGMQLVQ